MSAPHDSRTSRGRALLAALAILMTVGPGAASARAPDSVLVARLRQATEVRVCRLDAARGPRKWAGPGEDGSVAGYPARAWRPAPDSAWVARMIASLSSPESYPEDWATEDWGSPEIGVQFRGPAGVCDVLLCYSWPALVIASAPEAGRSADLNFGGDFSGALSMLMLLAMRAFPDDAEIRGWTLGETPPPPDAPEDGEDEPLLIKAVPPKYPEAARDRGIQGTVVVNALIGKSGRVVKARVARGIPELDEAALEAVRQFRFKPAVANGRKVRVWVAIPVAFPPRGE